MSRISLFPNLSGSPLDNIDFLLRLALLQPSHTNMRAYSNSHRNPWLRACAHIYLFISNPRLGGARARVYMQIYTQNPGETAHPPTRGERRRWRAAE